MNKDSDNIVQLWESITKRSINLIFLPGKSWDYPRVNKNTTKMYIGTYNMSLFDLYLYVILTILPYDTNGIPNMYDQPTGGPYHNIRDVIQGFMYDDCEIDFKQQTFKILYHNIKSSSQRMFGYKIPVAGIFEGKLDE